ncbi:hypothetical protein [Paraglaciecola sp. 25GB23A]|uniref:hypothetical protein n=1 Tax=Paraglaciecola sp. 25GB23A TaxID=3156068 RepID=UPI0032AFD916
MSCNLYLFTVENYPEGIADPESLLLMQEGFEGKSEDEEISLDELNFASTLAIHSDKPELVIADFQKWWEDRTGEIPKVSLLACDASHLQEFREKEVRSLGIDTWSIKSNFVAYASSSDEGKISAVGLIKESELNIQ